MENLPPLVRLKAIEIANALLEEGLAIRRELGDTRGIAGALTFLAHLRRLQWDVPAARALVANRLGAYRPARRPGPPVGNSTGLALAYDLDPAYKRSRRAAGAEGPLQYRAFRSSRGWKPCVPPVPPSRIRS